MLTSEDIVQFAVKEKGSKIGSPISSILAEFKLRPLAEFIFNTFQYKPRIWVRYVIIEM